MKRWLTSRQQEQDVRTAFERARLLLQSPQASRQHVMAAAVALENAGLVENAVGVLLQRGYADEAAKLLLARNRGEDAANIYVQARQWDKAAQSLLRANKPDRAAHCAVRAGDFTLAARLYEKVGALDEAASCFTRLGEDRRAARLYAQLGRPGQARESYLKWLDMAADDTDLDVAEQPALVALLATLGDEPSRAEKLSRLLGASGAADAIDTRYIDMLGSGFGAPSSKVAEPVEETVVVEGLSNDAIPSDPDQRSIFLGSDFLRTFAPEEQEVLWSLGTLKSFRRGEVIVDYDERPKGSYTILDGNVAVYRTASSDPGRPVDELSDGQTFGESWSLLCLRSAVRIVAVTDTELHVVDRQKLSEFLTANAQTTTELHRRMSDSLVAHLVRRVGEESPNEADA